jgi:hypothetical protein
MIQLSEKGSQAALPLTQPNSETPVTPQKLNNKILAQFERALNNAGDYSISLGFNGLIAYSTESDKNKPLCMKKYKVELLIDEQHKRISLGNIIPFQGSQEDLDTLVDNNMYSKFTQIFSLHYEELTNRVYDQDSGSCIIA